MIVSARAKSAPEFEGFPPHEKCEGVERRTAQPLASAFRRARPLWGRVAVRRCTVRLFRPRRLASGRDAGGAFWAPLIRRASARLRSRARPALQGQPVLMPADGWPGPSERGGTSPARGRRRHPTFDSVLQNAPHAGWLGVGIYALGIKSKGFFDFSGLLKVRRQPLLSCDYMFRQQALLWCLMGPPVACYHSC
jgi:hypothetical protein